MSYGAARPVLEKVLTEEKDNASSSVGAENWLAWVHESDSRVRQRLEIGEEDSLTNLLRFGVTYAKEFRIDDDYLVRYGQSSLVNSFAENRANDLIKALAAPIRNTGFLEMRAFVERKGFSLSTSAGKKKLKAYLLANLARMQQELLQAREHVQPDANRSFAGGSRSIATCGPITISISRCRS